MNVGFVKVECQSVNWNNCVCNYITKIDVITIDKNHTQRKHNLQYPKLIQFNNQDSEQNLFKGDEEENEIFKRPTLNLAIVDMNMMVKDTLKVFANSFIFVSTKLQKHLLRSFVPESCSIKVQNLTTDEEEE